MKLKYVAIGTMVASLLLGACDININTGSNDDSNNDNKQSQKNDSKRIITVVNHLAINQQTPTITVMRIQTLQNILQKSGYLFLKIKIIT